MQATEATSPFAHLLPWHYNRDLVPSERTALELSRLYTTAPKLPLNSVLFAITLNGQDSRMKLIKECKPLLLSPERVVLTQSLPWPS